MLSIIIPVYNIARHLGRCLQSIVSQSYQDFEILLVDDGSKDDSLLICKQWHLRDNRIQVFHKDNGGVSSARNFALDNLKGDFVTFVDGDDYLLPGMYERMMSLQEQKQSDIVICGFSKEKVNGEFVPYDSCDKILTLSQQEQLKCLFENRHFSCSCCDKIFRREVISSLRFNQKITHYEDLLFCYEAMKKSSKAVFTAEPYYRYCDNEGLSASRKPFGDKQMTMLDVWDYILEDCLTLFPELKDIVTNQYYRNYIMCMSMAQNAGYKNKDNMNRIKKVIRKNLFGILFCPLALGYKKKALMSLIIPS